MRGASNVGLLIAGVLVVLLVGGGLFLSGVFDEPAPIEQPDGGRPTVAETSRNTPQRPGPVEGGSIRTEEYSGRAAAGSAGVTKVEGGESDLVAGGTVVDVDGRPVEGAQVALIRDVSPVRGNLMEGAVLATVETGKNGGFDFESMPTDGNYMLRARHPDYTTEYAGQIHPAEGAISRKRIVLHEGMALFGKVSDENAMPIDGVTVQVFDLNVKSADPMGVIERQSLTTEDGRFEVAHLKGGLKRVVVTKDGWSADGRNALNLSQGENNELVFVLRAGHAISGIVVDSRTRVPVVGAIVHARPVSFIDLNATAGALNNSAGIPDSGAPPAFQPGAAEEGEKPSPPIRRVRGSVGEKAFLVANTTTDEEGRFRLAGLLEARYMVSVMAEGYQPMTGRPSDVGETNLEFQLIPSARLSGLVIDAETGEPVENFSIAVTPQDQPLFVPENLKKRFSNPEGRFEYPDVRPGTQYVMAMAQGYAPARSEAYQVANEQQIEGVVLRLERGATLIGRCVNGDGMPVQGATATLVMDRGNQPPNPFMMVLMEQMYANSTFKATSGSDGVWRIEGVAAGDYKVKVAHRDYVGSESSAFSCAARGELELGDFALTQGGVVRGSVSRKDGKPDGQATVMIQATDPSMAGSSRSVTTQSDGTFEAKGLTPGTYRVLVSQREGQFDLMVIIAQQQTARQIVVRDGEVTELEL